VIRLNILAIDVGGTCIKYGIFCGEKSQFGQYNVNNQTLLESLCTLATADCYDYIGVAVPGPFDFSTGTSYMKHKLLPLYEISLLDILHTAAPKTTVEFIHDSTAFCLGAMEEFPELFHGGCSCVMLGTGLGYAYAENGRVFVDENETPSVLLWKKPYRESTAENYVSATALVRMCQEQGYGYQNTFDMACAAKNGDTKLLSIFHDAGKYLAEIMEEEFSKNKAEVLIIGGQVSRSWELMKSGFEAVSQIPYKVVGNPSQSALYGIRRCAFWGKKALYMKNNKESKNEKSANDNRNGI